MRSKESDQQQTAEMIGPKSVADTRQTSLRDNVAASMARYFEALDGQPTRDLYNLVMAQVEPPLLESAMAYTSHNQSKTAALLGLNRGTLRRKLKQYNLI